MDKLNDQIQKKIKWEETPSKRDMTWYEAIEYCKFLGDGWRLPTINELGEAQKNKIEVFKLDCYWSNYTHKYNEHFAYAFLFEIGFIINRLKNYRYSVHCIKEIE
jgi:hypothetical protein